MATWARPSSAAVAASSASVEWRCRIPIYPKALVAGGDLVRPLICRTFSDCTTAPRSGLISGCFPLDPFYKAHPQRVALTTAKREAKARLAGE
ncbi:MAG: hypothetical protein R2706_06095 [Acidimicrobiales bacterium]